MHWAICLTQRQVSCYRASMSMTRPLARRACARVRLLVSAWFCSAGLWLSSDARAQAQAREELERTLTVTRELPGCVSAASLRARTAQYLGRTGRVDALRIEVDLRAPHFRVLRDGRVVAERHFPRAPIDCSERRDALALALAIAIEQAASDAQQARGSAARSGKGLGPRRSPRARPDGTGASPAGAAAPSITPAGAQARPRAAERDAWATAPANRSTRDQVAPPQAVAADTAQQPPLAAAERAGALALLAGAGVLFEVLPQAAPAGVLGAELTLSRAFRVGLSGVLSLPASSAFQGGAVSTQLYAAQVTGCVNMPLAASVLLHGCLGAVGGVVAAQGTEFARNLTDRMAWLASIVRARLEFPVLGRVAASVYADARINLLRPELQVSLASEPARTQAVAVVGASLGAELIVRLH